MCALYDRIPKRILIVDDDLDLLMLLERRLLREGYEVDTAASLPEAEELISTFQPHLILLDINVKGDDGRKLAWKLKHDPATSSIRVIMVSGFDFSTSRAVLFGADDLLPKPLHVDFLLHRLDLLLLASQNRIEFSE